jgi:predicted tellurium resistance membrane protein TerC
MFDWILRGEGWAALASLLALEIVLGVDNIIFLSIIVGRLPKEKRELTRKLGLGLALFGRLALLFSLTWVMRLVEPWFTVFDQEISGRDVILILGGLFLLAKSTQEIHNSLELADEEGQSENVKVGSYYSVLLQIVVLDIVFSLDSVITAVGLVGELSIMVIAIVIAILVMLFAVNPISDFVDNNPSIKMLALSFLLLVGFTLVIEGFDVHVPKGYIYFAMAFSIGVELLNMRLRKKRQSKGIQLQKNVPL